MNQQKGFANIILVIITVLLSGAVGYFIFIKQIENQPTKRSLQTDRTNQQSSPEANIDDTKLICNDSDNGDNYYTRGSVDFSEPFTLKEGTMVQVLSSDKATMRIGKETREVAVGESYSFSVPDDIFYLKPDNSNGNLLIDILVTVLVKKINFTNVSNSNNSVSIIKKTNPTDQCIGNVLIENSCVRGINNGYLCTKGCNQGACVK